MLEGFTATNIDGQDLTQETTTTDAVQENEQGQVAEQGEVQNEIETNLQEEKVEDAVQEQPAEEVPVGEQAASSEEVQQPQQEEQKPFETATVSFGEPEVEETTKEAAMVDFDAPKGVDLLTFIEENKDLIGSYNSLNQNFDEMEAADLIGLHLKEKHPNLSQADINSLLEDYSYDEELDSGADVVRKKIAVDNAVADAKDFFNAKRETLTNELATRNLGGPTKAEIEAQQAQQAAVDHFNQSTEKFFTQELESFTFQLNDEKGLALKINDKEGVMKQQASIETFLKPYFDENTGQISDPAGYHRAIFAAMNIDAITKNAYEQGRADAITQTEKEAKNIDMNSKTTHASNPVPGTTWKIT